MTDVIVDTNVAVVANGQNDKVTRSCTEACINFIIEAQQTHIIFIDDCGEIISEYAKALGMSPDNGLGARFLQHIYNHQWDTHRVRRVKLCVTNNGDFVDFPQDPALSKFDRDDRKFAALSKKTGVCVTNATDTDWINDIIALNKHGIFVNFLCGPNKADWLVS